MAIREVTATWRTAKLTHHYAEIKAMVYLVIMRSNSNFVYTEYVIQKAYEYYAARMSKTVAYKTAMEALHELVEQGFLGVRGGTNSECIWFAKERILPPWKE